MWSHRNLLLFLLKIKLQELYKELISMTYVYEYTVNGDNVKVEYCFSTVSDEIKVVDMWVNGKFHRTNWMSHEGRALLMARLEHDMSNRMCGTDNYDSEIDLDRDMPGFEGSLNTLAEVGV